MCESSSAPDILFPGNGEWRIPIALDAGGVTYLDTYFVRADHADVESLHFHELIHVIQWQLLGPERFLALYADGLERFGYRHSPLEVMAYDLQERFEREPPFEVEAACRKRMRELTGLGGNPTILDGQ